MKSRSAVPGGEPDRCVPAVFWESTVVCLSGAVLGFGAAALLSGISPGMLALPLLGYLAAYLLGAAAAILLFKPHAM